MASKGVLNPPDNPKQMHLLQKWMYVKEDKPHSVYHAEKLLQNLKEMSAEVFATETRNPPTELECDTGY